MIEDLLQPRHLLVILAVALFLFGPKNLPELGKGLAEGIRGFKTLSNRAGTVQLSPEPARVPGAAGRKAGVQCALEHRSHAFCRF